MKLIALRYAVTFCDFLCDRTPYTYNASWNSMASRLKSSELSTAQELSMLGVCCTMGSSPLILHPSHTGSCTYLPVQNHTPLCYMFSSRPPSVFPMWNAGMLPLSLSLSQFLRLGLAM
jgi:hypothetical protein